MRVLARPVGRLLVHPLDVRLELKAIDPPHATPAELDRREASPLRTSAYTWATRTLRIVATSSSV